MLEILSLWLSSRMLFSSFSGPLWVVLNQVPQVEGGKSPRLASKHLYLLNLSKLVYSTKHQQFPLPYQPLFGRLQPILQAYHQYADWGTTDSIPGLLSSAAIFCLKSCLLIFVQRSSILEPRQSVYTKSKCSLLQIVEQTYYIA